MINFIYINPPVLQRFLNKFKDAFTKPAFLCFSFYVNGLFLQLKRTNIQSITANVIHANYENMQYFISEAKWDEEKLNNCRIQILQSNRPTKSSHKGVLVIDDTGCKKWGYKTEGVKIQHYGTERIETKCNVVVVSAYADSVKRYPINLKPYKPKEEFLFGKDDFDFKSKHQLAKELIDDARSKNISFSDIVLDNWYFSNDLIEDIQDAHLSFITESESTRLISFKGKWVRADELVKLIPIDKFKWVTVPTPSKKNKSFYTYSFTAKLKDLPGKFLIVIAIGKWSKDDPKDVHVFVSNHLSYSPLQVISKYALRWSIECIFRDLKENVAFDHYQVRSLKSISRHWHLASLAYTFLLICKLNGSFSKTFAQQPKTIGEQLLLFRNINSIYQALWIKQNYEIYQNHLKLKRTIRLAA
ncbi:MAG: IS701 family transposase [Candidatus Edwardsbacteria bacterium]